MGGKKPLRRPLWPPTRATASNYYPLGLDGAGGAAKPLLRAPKKPAPLHGRLPAFSGAVDAFERARKCFLEWRYFFSIILSEFLKNRVALHLAHQGAVMNRENKRKQYEKGYYKTHGCSDSFTCKVCGRLVVPTGAGSDHRNHCPNCLSSLHLDIEPGDREADCGGIMDPVGVWVRKNGEWAIIHRCRRCGHLSSNRVAADDNPMKLMSIAMKPLSQPPFPLEKIEEMTALMGGDGQLSYG